MEDTPLAEGSSSYILARYSDITAVQHQCAERHRLEDSGRSLYSELTLQSLLRSNLRSGPVKPMSGL